MSPSSVRRPPPVPTHQPEKRLRFGQSSEEPNPCVERQWHIGAASSGRAGPRRGRIPGPHSLVSVPWPRAALRCLRYGQLLIVQVVQDLSSATLPAGPYGETWPLGTGRPSLLSCVPCGGSVRSASSVRCLVVG